MTVVSVGSSAIECEDELIGRPSDETTATLLTRMLSPFPREVELNAKTRVRLNPKYFVTSKQLSFGPHPTGGLPAIVGEDPSPPTIEV